MHSSPMQKRAVNNKALAKAANTISYAFQNPIQAFEFHIKACTDIQISYHIADFNQVLLLDRSKWGKSSRGEISPVLSWGNLSIPKLPQFLID